MQFSVDIFEAHAHAATIYGYSYKEMLSKSITLVARAWHNKVVAYVIAIRKNYSAFVVYMHVNDGSILFSRWSLQKAERHLLSSY